MELTLKRLLEQAKFTTTRKGYDQDEVDDFLDRAVAMATKVEARLTQALADAGTGTATPAEAPAAPGRSDEEIQAEIAAAVEERVQARVAELEAAAAERTVGQNDASAEEAARTLVLAQRTADAAVAEARQEAADLLAKARAEATELTGQAERTAEEQRRAVEEEAERARSEARTRLAGEINALEDARNGLRTDVSTLEGHVEEQRLQLRSTVAELQRLLDDPSAFRLAPAPATREVAVPDLDEEPGPAADGPGADPVDPVHAEPTEDPTDEATDHATGVGPAPGSSGPAAAGAPLGAREIEIRPSSDADGSEGRETIDLTGPKGPSDAAEAPRPGALPDTGPTDPDALLDVGPPTAPVSAIELDFDVPQEQAPEPSDAVDLPFGGQTGPIGPVGDDTGGDDAFLAELRKAMADEEPLGPRDAEFGGSQPGFLDEERRGWRFGKRR